MDKRPLGKTGLDITEVGLGCWQLAGDWRPVSELTAAEILSTAVDNGIRFFDTADVYGEGKSEQIIGRFLQSCSESIFVATKVGRTKALYPDKYTLEGITQHVERSHRRLKVDTLDLLQLHCVPPTILQQGEIFDWLDLLMQQGKIRHYGASVETIEEGLLCLEQPNLVSLQIIFNCLRQKPLETLLKKASEKKVGLIVRLPLASGLLSGKFSAETTFETDDPRHYNRDGDYFNVGEIFGGLEFAKGLDFVNAIRPWVPEGMNMAQMALRWILDFDAVTAVIPGATRPDQVLSNATASALPPLSKSLHQNLRDLYQNQVTAHVRGVY